VKTHAAARRVESEDTPLRGLWEVLSCRPLRGRQSPHMVISLLQSAGSKGTSDRHAFCARIAADVSLIMLARRYRASRQLEASYPRAAFPCGPNRDRLRGTSTKFGSDTKFYIGPKRHPLQKKRRKSGYFVPYLRCRAAASSWLRQANRGQTGYLRGAAGTSAVGGRPVGGGGGRPAGRPAGGGHHAKRRRVGFLSFSRGRRENARR